MKIVTLYFGKYSPSGITDSREFSRVCQDSLDSDEPKLWSCDSESNEGNGGTKPKKIIKYYNPMLY